MDTRRSQDHNISNKDLPFYATINALLISNSIIFEEPINFEGTQFSQFANFSGAQFSEDSHFEGAQFNEYANFDAIKFCRCAFFNGSYFDKSVSFSESQFSEYAGFGRSQFKGNADFSGSQFKGNADFSGSQFSGDVLTFRNTQFSNHLSQEDACRRAKQLLDDRGDREEAGYHFYREMEAKRLQKGTSPEGAPVAVARFWRWLRSVEKQLEQIASDHLSKLATKGHKVRRFIYYNLFEYIYICSDYIRVRRPPSQGHRVLASRSIRFQPHLLAWARYSKSRR